MFLLVGVEWADGAAGFSLSKTLNRFPISTRTIENNWVARTPVKLGTNIGVSDKSMFRYCAYRMEEKEAIRCVKSRRA